jgi:hypothetical protein
VNLRQSEFGWDPAPIRHAAPTGDESFSCNCLSNGQSRCDSLASACSVEGFRQEGARTCQKR